jgi:hypothetical protein
MENPHMWTMRDGCKIRVADMTEKHLKNAIVMLEHQYDKALDCMCMAYGYSGTGDMAQYQAQAVGDRAGDEAMRLLEAIQILRMEQESRINALA